LNEIISKYEERSDRAEEEAQPELHSVCVYIITAISIMSKQAWNAANKPQESRNLSRCSRKVSRTALQQIPAYTHDKDNDDDDVGRKPRKKFYIIIVILRAKILATSFIFRLRRERFNIFSRHAGYSLLLNV
jgi:hypothetical protein